MIKISIIKNSQVTNVYTAIEAEATAWLARHEGMKSFGEPSQIVQQQVEISPAVIDAEGNEISPAQFEVQEIHIPSSYEVEVLDITSLLEQEKINAEALAFLAATDYVVIRAVEKGEEVSEELKAERQSARDRIVR